MPQWALAEDNDTEDFIEELHAIEDSSSESDDDLEQGSTSDDTRSNLGTARRIMTVPQSDAHMHEVHKVLSSFFTLVSCLMHSHIFAHRHSK
jgi:hypothetical protein